MKKNLVRELHTKTKEELKALLADKTKEFTKIRLDVASKRIKNTSLLKNTRKDIAQILTVLKEKEHKENV